MKALTLFTPGKSDVLEYKDVADPILKPDEILVKMEAIGLNFADIMRRNGVYPLRGSAPYINGYEGAGVVIDNNNNKMFKIGDRIGFADVPFANAELVAVPVANAIPLPADISFETAASVLLQGLTVQYLTSDSHQVKPGETVLIHATAGGVGQLLIQVCKLLGAKVIGLTSSESKRDISLLMGADYVFLYSEDWKTKILELFPNGLDVVYESVGSTMKESIEVTRICGQIVLFGLAGDKLELGNPLLIIANSITITGGDLWNYLTSGEERVKRAQQLFGWIRSNQVTVVNPAKFKLAEGRLAHDFLESRKSTGKILLIP